MNPQTPALEAGMRALSAQELRQVTGGSGCKPSPCGDGRDHDRDSHHKRDRHHEGGGCNPVPVPAPVP